MCAEKYILKRTVSWVHKKCSDVCSQYIYIIIKGYPSQIFKYHKHDFSAAISITKNFHRGKIETNVKHKKKKIKKIEIFLHDISKHFDIFSEMFSKFCKTICSEICFKKIRDFLNVRNISYFQSRIQNRGKSIARYYNIVGGLF